MLKFKSFVNEDAPANAAGGGAVAGIGVGPSGEPPRKKKPKILRRRLVESEDIKAHKVPFEKNPHIGWYKDKDHIVAYHGTHERNLHSVLKHGLTHKDPKTGHISVAVDVISLWPSTPTLPMDTQQCQDPGAKLGSWVPVSRWWSG